MEIGRAITMDDKTFRSLYATTTQEGFLRGIAFMKDVKPSDNKRENKVF